jgi:dihydroflavonol-4-reductase
VKFHQTPRLGTEEEDPDPRDLMGHYKRSKYQAELQVRHMASQGLPVVIVNPTAPVGTADAKPTPTGQVILDFLRGRMPFYLDTGLNLVDVEDVAAGHLLALQRGKVGCRYILGNRNVTLKEMLEMLAVITGRRAPRWRVPYWMVLAAGHLDMAVEGMLLRRPPRIPLEGVKQARKYMWVDCSRAVRELGMPQSSVEGALEKAVRWYREKGYVKG